MSKNTKLNRYVIFSFIVPLIVIGLGLCFGGFLPFGLKDILTASGNESMIPYYYEMWDAFHSGHLFFFSSKTGSGYDFSTVITYYLSDPINMVVMLFPKSMILPVLNILFAFKVCLSGTFFYLYLSKRGEDGNEVLKLALSVAYALSGCALGCGLDITVTSVFMLFPLVMVGLEKLHRGEKLFAYICFMSLCVFCSFRLAVVVWLFTILYLVSLGFSDVKHFVSVVVSKLFSDIIVAGIGSVVIINNLSSSFFRNDYSLYFPELRMLKSGTEIIKSLFVDQYVGVIVLILALLFFVNSKISFWKRLRFGLLGLFLLMSGFVSTPNYLISGLTKSLAGKTSVGFVFLVLLLSFEALTNLNLKNDGNDKYEKIKKIGKKFVKVAPILIMVEVVCVGCIYLAIAGRKSVSYENTETYKAAKCVDYIHENYENAKILLYSSEDSVVTPVSNLLLGYNYIVQLDKSDMMDSHLEYMGECEGLSIYYNPDATPDNKFVDSRILNWESDLEYVFASCNEFSNALGIGDIFEVTTDNIQVLPDLTDKTYKTTNLIYSFDEPGEYYVNYQGVAYLGSLDSGEESLRTYHLSAEEMRDSILTRETVRYDEESFTRLIDAINNGMASSNDNLAEERVMLVPYDMSKCFNASSDSGDMTVRTGEVFGEGVTYVEGNDGEISFSYKPFNLIKGAIIRLISLFVLLMAYVISRCIKNKKEHKLGRVERFIESNRVYLYTLLLSVAMWLVIVMVNSCVPFGTSTSVVSDGFIEDYPTTMSLVDSLKHFRFSVVDYSIGFERGGVGFASYQYFMDPIRLVMLLFSDSKLLLAFNVYYACLFVLTGQTMLIYLIHRPHGGKLKKQELKLIPIAMCYNLSSFVLCYYSYAGFLEFALILPLIMLAVDRLIYEKKYLFYTLILAYFIVLSTYFAFILCIFLVLYFFVLDHKGFKELVKNGIRFALFSILSAGLASFTLLSFYGAVTNSGYIDQDTTNNSSINVLTQNLLGNVTDFEVLHRISQATIKSNVANTYAGLLLVLVIPVYLMIKKYSLSLRIRRVAILALLYFAYGNDLLNYVFHGFHFQSMVPNRFSLFFIFLLVISFYDVVCNYRVIFEKKSVIAYLIFSACILLTIYYKSMSSMGGRLVSMAFIAGYSVTILMGYKTKRHYHFTKMLLLILSFELMISGANTAKGAFKGFTYLQKSSGFSSELANEHGMKNGNLVRASLLDKDLSNLACVSGYNTTDIFTSTLQAEQIDLANNWGMEQGVNYLIYGIGNPLSDIILNNRYFFINSNYMEGVIPTYLRKIDSKSFVSLYENPYGTGVGIVVPVSTKDMDFRKCENLFEFQNEFAEELVGKTLYEIIDPAEYEAFVSEDKGSISLNIYSEDLSGDYFAAYCNRIVYMGNTDGEEPLYNTAFRLTSDEKRVIMSPEVLDNIRVARLNVDTLEALSTYFAEHSMTNVVVDGYKIAGDIDLDEEGYVYIPIPSTDGWDIKVDGRVVERETVLSGIGVKVSSGKHDIELVKKTSYSFKPYILSVISLVILVCIVIIGKKKRIFERQVQ